MLKTLCWVAVGMVGTAVSAGAQSGGPVCSLAFHGDGKTWGGPRNPNGYTVTAKSSTEQQLLDGSYVRGFAIVREAQDSLGRKMNEVASGCSRGVDGQPQLHYYVFVNDYKTGASERWIVGEPTMPKVARVTHVDMPELPRRSAAADLEVHRKIVAPRKATSDQEKVEDLGTRTILGFEAHGQRIVKTIPIGGEGNELPLVLTHEIWAARDPSYFVLLSIDDDPRRGKVIYEVQDVKVGAPNAALFAPPAGYVVKDVTPERKGVVVERIPAVGGQP